MGNLVNTNSVFNVVQVVIIAMGNCIVNALNANKPMIMTGL